MKKRQQARTLSYIMHCSQNVNIVQATPKIWQKLMDKFRKVYNKYNPSHSETAMFAATKNQMKLDTLNHHSDKINSHQAYKTKI
jgi:hypothetical protein